MSHHSTNEAPRANTRGNLQYGGAEYAEAEAFIPNFTNEFFMRIGG